MGIAASAADAPLVAIANNFNIDRDGVFLRKIVSIHSAAITLCINVRFSNNVNYSLWLMFIITIIIVMILLIMINTYDQFSLF